ncbi:MAG: zinc ribbon domain-containing protein [Candidatus Nanoarchaeia archaeon]
MEEYSYMKNRYSLNKTIRFALSLNYEKNYIRNEEKTHYTHKVLENEIKNTYDKLKESLYTKKDFNEEELLIEVKDCITKINSFYKEWRNIYIRSDKLFIIKEYYRILGRKCLFDIPKEKYSKKQKKCVRIIYSDNTSLNSLLNKDKITNYWNKNFFYFQKLQKELEFEIQKYELTLKNNLSNQKPNLVDFRKKSLAIFNIANEILKPLNDKSITFLDLNFLYENKKNNWKYFGVNDELRIELENQIEELKNLFKYYGGNSFYKKITLNPYTLEKKVENYNLEIKDIISELKLIDLLNSLKSKNKFEIRNFFLNKNEKIEHFKNSVYKKNDKEEKAKLNILIQSIQLFKSKPLKPIVKYELSKFLEENYKQDLNLNQDEIYTILNNIGENIEIGKEYNEEKEVFDLNNYPIKLAFDYAWENLAKSEYYEVSFDRELCENFLKTNFEINIKSNDNFILFSKLSYLKDQLKNIDYNNNFKNRNKNLEEYKQKVKEILNELKEFKIEINQNKKIPAFNKNDDIGSINKNIISWINLSDEGRINNKENNSDLYKDYNKAKQKLGLKRGEQKNNIKEYKKLTQIFKTLSQDYGKKFSELRDKLNERYEINKIEDLGIVIEDENKDKYVLTIPKNYKDILYKDLLKKNNGNLKGFYVKSLTSKTLIKIIKNKGAYKEFNLDYDFNEIKINWDKTKKNKYFLNILKNSLQESTMAKIQYWNEFNFNFSNCNFYEDIEKEIDKKGYILKKFNLSKEKVNELIKDKGCFIFPIVNQNLISQKKNLKNQFTKDWNLIFDENSLNYRLHPEIDLSYRFSTPNYPSGKRYSRFQLNAQFLCEIVPQNQGFSKKEVLELYKKRNLINEIKIFNENSFIKNKPFYILGIDRGEKCLATLCILNQDGEIQGNFYIYTRSFDTEKKIWEHIFLEERNILDLTNLRVETTIKGEKVLVDLSKIKVKKDRFKGFEEDNLKENNQNIKLKQLAYRRKLQYQMQNKENKDLILRIANSNDDCEKIKKLKESTLISAFGVGEKYENLNHKEILDLLNNFKEVMTDENISEKDREKEINRIIELDSADGLKKGITANMIGVINYFIEKYNYNIYISVENLSKCWVSYIDGLNGIILEKSYKDNSKESDVDYKKVANAKLAGLGTYHYFEMQLLKKLFKIPNKNSEILHLVPPFRSVENYENIGIEKADLQYKQFGRIFFVDPSYTSKKCPNCDSLKTKRLFKNGDKLICNECGYDSTNDSTIKHSLKLKNINFIETGDNNGAYQIGIKTFRNLNYLKK